MGFFGSSTKYGYILLVYTIHKGGLGLTGSWALACGLGILIDDTAHLSALHCILHPSSNSHM